MGSKLPVVHGLRGPACDGLVHSVLYSQHPYHSRTMLLCQALHQAAGQPSQCCPVPKKEKQKQKSAESRRDTVGGQGKLSSISGPRTSPSFHMMGGKAGLGYSIQHTHHHLRAHPPLRAAGTQQVAKTQEGDRVQADMRALCCSDDGRRTLSPHLQWP